MSIPASRVNAMSVTGGVIKFRRTVDSSDADLALFMDVLEHVDDDRELLTLPPDPGPRQVGRRHRSRIPIPVERPRCVP